MSVERSPQTCEWADPCLAAGVPVWLSEWCTRWCCVYGRFPHVVTPRDCATCGRWQLRAGLDVRNAEPGPAGKQSFADGRDHGVGPIGDHG